MAALLTINKGKSLTFGFVFPDSYDMNRIRDIKVYVGSLFYPYSISDKVLTCKLTSEQTSLLLGLTKVAIWIDDNKIGGYPIQIGDIQVVITNVSTASQSVNEGFDLLFNLKFTENTITIDSVFYNAIKGDSAFTVWQQRPGNEGKTEQDFINFIQKPAIEAAAIVDTATQDCNMATQNAIKVTNSLMSNIVSITIDQNMNLIWSTPDTYEGFQLNLNNGNLIATV
jgi:hypothetical protein